MQKASRSYNSVVGPVVAEEASAWASACFDDTSDKSAKRGGLLVYLPKDTLSYAAKYLTPHELASLGRVCRLLKVSEDTSKCCVLTRHKVAA